MIDYWPVKLNAKHAGILCKFLRGETLKLEIVRTHTQENKQAWKTAQHILKLICKLILSGKLSDVRLPPTAFLHNGNSRQWRCAVHQGEKEAAGSK